VYQLAAEKPSTIAAASLYLSCVAYNRPLPGPSVLVDRFHVEPTKIIAVAKALVEPAIQFLAKTERLHSLRDQYEPHFTFSALQKSRIRRFVIAK
jgi:hypothetical protein